MGHQALQRANDRDGLPLCRLEHCKSKDTVLRLSPLGTRMASGPFIGRENNSWSPLLKERFYKNRFHKVLPQPEFTETPRQFKTELKIAQMSSVRMAKEAQISLAEIHDYYDLHEVIPPEMRPRLQTQYHGRIAWSFTCLVVVLIAIPFGAGSGRRNVFAGVASSIFICFGYFILMRLGLALGNLGERFH